MQHEQVKVHNGAFVRRFAEIIDHLLAFCDEDLTNIFFEGLDGEDVACQLALEPPLGSI